MDCCDCEGKGGGCGASWFWGSALDDFEILLFYGARLFNCCDRFEGNKQSFALKLPPFSLSLSGNINAISPKPSISISSLKKSSVWGSIASSGGGDGH